MTYPHGNPDPLRTHAIADRVRSEPPPLRAVPREDMVRMMVWLDDVIDEHDSDPLGKLLRDLLSDALDRSTAPRVVLELAGVSGPHPHHMTRPEVPR